MRTTPSGGATRSLIAARVRHLLSGVLILLGAALVVLSVITAATGISGYHDVFSFLGSIAVGLFSIIVGVWLSE